jgi:hypothetical protein
LKLALSGIHDDAWLNKQRNLNNAWLNEFADLNEEKLVDGCRGGLLGKGGGGEQAST